MGNQNFYDFLIDSFEQIMDSTKPTAPMYIFHSHKTQAQFEQAMNESGIEMISQLIWNKPNVNHVGAKYKQKHEPFFYAHKKNQKEEWYGSDIFEETVQDVHVQGDGSGRQEDRPHGRDDALAQGHAVGRGDGDLDL